MMFQFTLRIFTHSVGKLAQKVPLYMYLGMAPSSYRYHQRKTRSNIDSRPL